MVQVVPFPYGKNCKDDIQMTKVLKKHHPLGCLNSLPISLINHLKPSEHSKHCRCNLFPL